jgi:recyclin-1
VIGHPGDGSRVLTKHTDHPVQTSEPRADIRETQSSQRDLSHAPSFEGFQLLLSLDIALSLIHADREALKRVETFAAYPGHYGHRVQETIEEVFILMVQAMSSRHIVPGFAKCVAKNFNRSL